MTSDYYAIKAINCSGIKEYNESKAQYYYRHIAKTWEGHQSDAFRLGSMLHTMVLEPEKFADEWTCENPPTGKTKDSGPVKSGKAYDAWASEMIKRPDQRWHTTAEHDEAVLWMQALRNHGKINAMLEHSGREVEKTLLATYGDRHALKGRCDLIIPSERIILDVKTSVSELPGEFRRTAYQRDYHMQAATYTSLAECTYGESFRFLFAVVSKGDKKASLIELPEAMMDQGHKRLREQSERLIESLEQWARGENIPGDWRTEVCVCD